LCVRPLPHIHDCTSKSQSHRVGVTRHPARQALALVANIDLYERLYLAPSPASVESESGSEDDFHVAVEWMEKDEKEKGEDEEKAGDYSEPVDKKEQKEEGMKRSEAGGYSVSTQKQEEKKEEKKKRGAGGYSGPSVAAKKHKDRSFSEE
jgi:hypothetical protein